MFFSLTALTPKGNGPDTQSVVLPLLDTLCMTLHYLTP
jgi:hypothetical protein